LVPGTQQELLARFGAAFCAVGGDVCPIDPDMMTELVDQVCSGRTVVLFADKRELRDAAKNQLVAAVNTSRHGAAGSA
jgi:hypothetical protein